MGFTLHHRRDVGERKQKISHLLLLFVHQQLYIADLLSVSLEISCKLSIGKGKLILSNKLIKVEFKFNSNSDSIQLSKSFTVVIRPLSTCLIKSISVSISHRRSTTVSLETKIFLSIGKIFVYKHFFCYSNVPTTGTKGP